jgi:hypothetical protein
VRIDTASDGVRMNLLLTCGVSLLPAVIFPPLVAVAAVSPGLLSVWVGHQFADHGKWLALFWALPALNTVVSFQNYVLISRNSYVRANNWLSFTQILVQLSISLILLDSLSQFAFIVGYISSMAALFVLQISLAHQEVHLPRSYIQRLGVYGAAMVGVVVAIHFVDAFARPNGWIAVGGSAIAVWGVLAALTYAFFLRKEDRALLAAIIKMIFQRSKNNIPSVNN